MIFNIELDLIYFPQVNLKTKNIFLNLDMLSFLQI